MRKFYTIVLILFVMTLQGQNKLLSSIYESYNGTSWDIVYGLNYTYDANNNLADETQLEWSTVSNTWKNSDKTSYTYNASNKVTEEVFQTFNPTTNNFENLGKVNYTYTSEKLTEIIYYAWENSNWVPEVEGSKILISYNANNLPLSVSNYDWNGSQFVIYDRSTLDYNVNDKLNSSITEEWIGAQWVNSFKSLYFYDANNKLLNERNATWDIFNATWVEQYRTDYVVDASGNRTTETNTEQGYQYREAYTYDSNILMSSFAHPFLDKTGVDYFGEDYPYINKVLTVTNSYDALNSNNFTNLSRTSYNYSNSITLGTETIEKVIVTISVYPNPASDFINIQNSSNIEIDKVVITDITGKQVLQLNQKANSINVQNLAKGMYLVEALIGDKKETLKFIKE